MLDAEAEGGAIGGGMIESFGFNSKAPNLPDGRTAVNDGEEVMVKPNYWLPLAMAAGSSSGAPYVRLKAHTTIGQKLIGGPTCELWSPADTTSSNNRVTNIADGGAVDNSAVLALLRRGVQHVVAQIAQQVAVTDPDFTNHVWWPSLFGRATVGMSNTSKDANALNTRSQVFDPEEYDKLMAEFKWKVEKGLPPVVEQTLEVRPNPRCGVNKNYKVHVLWVVAGVSPDFRSALPAETRQQLEKEPPAWKSRTTGVLHLLHEQDDLDQHFPFNMTFYGDYSTRLVRMLAENTAYNLIEGGGTSLKKFFENDSALDLETTLI